MSTQHSAAIELFRDACGLTTPLSLLCAEAGQSTGPWVAHAFDEPFVLIGRDARSDLVLDNEQVSRRHAFLQAVEGRVYVVDLESRSKIFWEGEGAPRTQGWLEEDRYVRIGQYLLRQATGEFPLPVTGELSPSDPGVKDVRGAPREFPRAAVELPIRMGAGASLWPLERRFNLVGRSDECQLVVTDESVSRFHAAIILTDAGAWVVDLRAREGVHVNGLRVRWAWLGEGDTLRFGRISFVLRYEVAPEQPLRNLVPLEAGASPPESPGTELVVRGGKRSANTGLPAVRREVRPAALRNVRISPKSARSAALVRDEGGMWEHAIEYMPHPAVMWQQQMQMMESFHNDMALMVEMFVAMHREHLNSVRHELDRVQHLTRELSELQSKLANPSQSAERGLTGSENAASRTGKSGQAAGEDKGSKRVSQKSTRDGRQTKPKSGNTEDGPIRGSAETQSEGDPGVAHADQGAGVGDSEFHAVLTRRIAEIQRERQGYWKKILSVLHS